MRINQIILECLIKADGFDSGVGSFSGGRLEKYTFEYFQKLGISSHDTIYDVSLRQWRIFIRSIYAKIYCRWY